MEISWTNGNKSSVHVGTVWGRGNTVLGRDVLAVSQGLIFGEHRIKLLRAKLKECHKHVTYLKDLVFTHEWEITARLSHPEDGVNKGDIGKGVLQCDSNAHLRF